MTSLRHFVVEVFSFSASLLSIRLILQATQREEENKIEASPAALSENGKPSAEHQHGSGEVGNGSNAEDLQAGAHLEAQNGEEDAAGNGPSSAAVTSQSATKAAAAQEVRGIVIILYYIPQLCSETLTCPDEYDQLTDRELGMCHTFQVIMAILTIACILNNRVI